MINRWWENWAAFTGGVTVIETTVHPPGLREQIISLNTSFQIPSQQDSEHSTSHQNRINLEIRIRI